MLRYACHARPRQACPPLRLRRANAPCRAAGTVQATCFAKSVGRVANVHVRRIYGNATASDVTITLAGIGIRPPQRPPIMRLTKPPTQQCFFGDPFIKKCGFACPQPEVRRLALLSLALQDLVHAWLLCARPGLAGSLAGPERPSQGAHVRVQGDDNAHSGRAERCARLPSLAAPNPPPPSPAHGSRPRRCPATPAAHPSSPWMGASCSCRC